MSLVIYIYESKLRYICNKNNFDHFDPTHLSESQITRKLGFSASHWLFRPIRRLGPCSLDSWSNSTPFWPLILVCRSNNKKVSIFSLSLVSQLCLNYVIIILSPSEMWCHHFKGFWVWNHPLNDFWAWHQHFKPFQRWYHHLIRNSSYEIIILRTSEDDIIISYNSI